MLVGWSRFDGRERMNILDSRGSASPCAVFCSIVSVVYICAISDEKGVGGMVLGWESLPLLVVYNLIFLLL